MWKINTFLQKSASVYWLGNALWYDRRATNEYGMGRYGWERNECCRIRGLTWMGNAENEVGMQLHLYTRDQSGGFRSLRDQTDVPQPHINHQYCHLPTRNWEINQAPLPSSHSGSLSLSHECRVIIRHPLECLSLLPGWCQTDYILITHTRPSAHA